MRFFALLELANRRPIPVEYPTEKLSEYYGAHVFDRKKMQEFLPSEAYKAVINAIEKGVPSENIFMDHAGFSTYESIYRAKEIFKAKKVVIVTQKYHLYRALYIANQLGLEAYGVGSDPRKYVGATYRELREILARDKDFIKCIFKPEPTYLGETIPVSSNGNATNDK